MALCREPSPLLSSETHNSKILPAEIPESRRSSVGPETLSFRGNRRSAGGDPGG